MNFEIEDNMKLVSNLLLVTCRNVEYNNSKLVTQISKFAILFAIKTLLHSNQIFYPIIDK